LRLESSRLFEARDGNDSPLRAAGRSYSRFERIYISDRACDERAGGDRDAADTVACRRASKRHLKPFGTLSPGSTVALRGTAGSPLPSGTVWVLLLLLLFLGLLIRRRTFTLTWLAR
jgi:hypothetical protein